MRSTGGDLVAAGLNAATSAGGDAQQWLDNWSSAQPSPQDLAQQGVQAVQQGAGAVQQKLGGAIDSTSPTTFAQTIAPYAQAAGQALGIDPSWVAAMAASESNYGKAGGNELFGIKALPGQPGTSMQTHEGEYGGTTQNATFASYDTPQDSVNAFVNLLQNHYPGAVGAQDLSTFVHGLKQGGYFTAAEPEYLGILSGINNRIGGTVQDALSSGQNAVQNVATTGQTAVNTASDTAQAAAARTSQFAMGLSSGDAMAFCYDAETRVLTRRGFLFFRDLADDDELATRTPDGLIEYHSPIARQHYRYGGPMYHFKSGTIDLLVTPDHQMLGLPHHRYFRRLPDRRGYVRREGAEPDLVPAQAMRDRAEFWHIPALAHWGGETTVTEAPVRCTPEQWAAFVGLWTAQGSADRSSQRVSVRAGGALAEPSRRLLAPIALAAGAPLRATSMDRPDRMRYSLRYGPLHDWLEPIRTSVDQRIPRELLQASPEVLAAILAGLWLGDGGKDRRHFAVYTTSSRQLADDVAELAIKLGFGASIGRTKITPPMRNPQYTVCLKAHETYNLRLSKHLRVIDDWEGDVYCATVPNHTLLVERNGRITWCGNCGPAAAMAFAETFGRNPTVDEAKQLAQQVGWNPDQGMAGPSSEVSLLNKLGIATHMSQGVDWSQVAGDASSGNPVIIDTPGHYFYVDGYNSDTGQFHLGTSATDLKASGGKEWFTPSQIPGLGMGDPRAAIFADHPLSGAGVASSAQQALSSAQQTAGGLSQQAQDTMSAVLDTGSQTAQDTVSGASNWLDSQKAKLSSGLTDVTGGAQDVLSQAQQAGGGDIQSLLDAAQQAGYDTSGLRNQVPDVRSKAQDLVLTAQSSGQDLSTLIQQAPDQAAQIVQQAAQGGTSGWQNLLSAAQQAGYDVSGLLSQVPDLSPQGIAGA
ncbi:MAG TPA: glucosaminidase domain-containing protein, partial [Streptosporangiaceae bacterium]